MTFYFAVAIFSLTMIFNLTLSNRGPGKHALGTIVQRLEWNVGAPLTVAQSDNTQRSNADTTNVDKSSIGSHLSLQEVQQLIRLHNKVRADVGSGPVTWSKKLAIYAQEWAHQLGSTDCKLKHRPKSGKWKQEYGENLFMGVVGYYGVANAIKAWENERKYYRGQTLTSSNWYDSGHYTQMVWKDSKEIGCAKAECNDNIIVVCNYDPPGNILGQKPY
jgi:pathogenesis-related protein 1